MATLSLLRHAASQAFAARDRERALTPDGIRAARAVGRVIAATAIPDRVVVSTARRARETLDEAMAGGSWRVAVTPSDVLYGGSVDEVLDEVARDAAGSDAVLVVGHEPWCSGLIGLLTGANLRMSTAALATIEVGSTWASLDPQWCSLTSFVPAQLVDRLATVDAHPHG